MSSLKGLEDLDPKVTVVKEVASVIPFLIKTAVVLGVGYYLYSRWTNRFIPLKEKSNYGPANITMDQAQTRADAIASSIGWFSNSFDAVADNLKGLNYNGFIRVYNAFGYHTGTLLSGDLNLIEWIKNQFTEEEVAQLSSLQNGVFFRQKENNLFKITSGMTQEEKEAFAQLIFE